MIDYRNTDREKIVGTYNRFDSVIAKGHGATATDEDGARLIDFTSGIGVNSLGYCDPQWVAAVTDQLSKVQHTANLYYSMPQIELADMLTTKANMAKVFFANSGAEANECAIKAARKWGNDATEGRKHDIITLANGFHGRTMATITATGQDHYHEHFAPFLSGFKYCKPGDLAAMKALADDDT